MQGEIDSCPPPTPSEDTLDRDLEAILNTWMTQCMADFQCREKGGELAMHKVTLSVLTPYSVVHS